MSPLTISYRRAEVIAFWIVATGVAWLSGSVAAAAIELRPSWLWGFAAAIAVVAPGAFWIPWFEAGIWLWNGSTRRVAALLRWYVLAVSYYTLFAALGASRSAIVGRARLVRVGCAAERRDHYVRRRPAREQPGGMGSRNRALCSSAGTGMGRHAASAHDAAPAART